MQTKLYINSTEGTLKMWPVWAVVLYIQVKIISTIHQWENEASIYRQ